jgi:hypothetical protein
MKLSINIVRHSTEVLRHLTTRANHATVYVTIAACNGRQLSDSLNI